MTTPTSQWPTRYKLLAIALLVAVVGVVWWFASTTAKMMPDYILTPVVVGIIAFGLGAIWGEKSTIKQLTRSGHLQKGWERDAPP